MAKRYRFPGVNSFGKNDVAIFKGRDIDARNIYTQLMLFKTLVLHSDSGTGKSSIIQAGLLPLIEKSDSGYVPVIINLNDIVKSDADSILTDHTISKILAACAGIEHEKLELFDHSTSSLWVLAKKLEKKGKSLLLIFDQFETLQSFNPAQIKNFKDELLKLLNNKIPPNIYEEIQKNIRGFNPTLAGAEKSEELNRNYKFLSNPVNAKALFVIREDKLGTMSLLSDYFPDILKNNFILPSLTKENAYRALVEPALAEGDFDSPPFTFENEQDARNLINVIADDQTKLVDPMQLQIAASSIERNVVIKNNKTTVASADIPEITDIINAYYKGCWERVNAKLNENEVIFQPEAFEQKKKSVIDKLIVNDRRNLVHANLLISKNNSRADSLFINELVADGLIRRIPGKDVFYQLCHDRFIKPVMDDIALFDEKEAARLNQLELEKKQQELEEERQRQEQEIEKQKKYIAEVEQARRQADEAQEEALNALIAKEETLSALSRSNQKMKKYRNYVIAVSVIVFFVSLYTLWSALKSRDLTRINIANRLITEAKNAYNNEKHDLAFRRLQEAVNEQKSDSAKKLIDSLTFYEMVADQIVVSQKNKNVVAAIYPDKTATIWNIGGSRLIRIKDLNDVGAIRISNSGKKIAYVNANGDLLRILRIDDNNNTHIVKDSVILEGTKKEGLKSDDFTDFNLNNYYSFQFSPEEDYAYYRLSDLKLKLVTLEDKGEDPLHKRLLSLLKPVEGDNVLWIDFSFDEAMVGIYREKSLFKVFSLPENKYLYNFPKATAFHFHNSLPVFYAVETDQRNIDKNVLEITDYQLKKTTIVRSQRGFFYQVNPSSLNVDYSVVGYKTSDSTYRILNTITGNSASFIYYYNNSPKMMELNDQSKFWYYDGGDSLLELNKKDLSASRRYRLKVPSEPFISWQQDNAVAYSMNDLVFIEGLDNGKVDSIPYKNISLENKAGHYLLGKLKIYQTSSFVGQIMVLTKPRFLKPEDKITYFDSIYPVAEEHKKH